MLSSPDDTHPLQPLILELPGWREPLDILPAFSDQPGVALLHSAGPPEAGPEVCSWSLLGARPFDSFAWRVADGGDPLGALQRTLAAHRSAPAASWPFAGGAIGWIGYDAARSLETIPAKAAATHGYPDIWFGLYAAAVLWDHRRRRWAIVATGAPHQGQGRLEAQRAQAEELRSRLERVPEARQGAPGSIDPSGKAPDSSSLIEGSSLQRDAYLERVERARELIAAGDLYQVNLSQRLELPSPPDPVDFFSTLCRSAPAPFAAYLSTGGTQILSSSPERFLRLREGRAESRPIKGTRPRGAGPDEDARLLAALRGSAKDRAENVMIVDLVRNDLGRVCIPGSVEATSVCAPESYAAVHHLVSCIEGNLRPDRDRGDLLRALFPGGSMTGAPKVSAMRAIEALEPVRRGVYAGALGYLSFDGSLDLSIVIRTLVLEKGKCWLSVGGAVVADSEPLLEYEESLHKAASVLRALAACRSARRPDRRTANLRSAR